MGRQLHPHLGLRERYLFERVSSRHEQDGRAASDDARSARRSGQEGHLAEEGPVREARERDGGRGRAVVFAVGPADGWSDNVRTEAKRRDRLLSFGPMTLAHQLARLVMAEQLYRACTILTGHPYHKGH